MLPPAPVNPCSAALRTATVAERCPRLTVSLDRGVPSGGGVSTGSPAGSESPACSPTQAGWRESSAPSCPSADQALRASSPPRPFRKVAQPHPRRAAASRNSAFQPAVWPAARNKCTKSTSCMAPPCTTVLGGPKPLFCSPAPSLTFSLASPWTHLRPRCPPPRPHPSPSLTSAPLFAAPSPFCGSGQPEAHSYPQAPGPCPTPPLPPIPARALPLTLSPCPCPVLSLKQLLLPSEEDSGVGPPLEGDGVPGGGPPSPAQPQEIREELLSLEETIKQLEVVALGWVGRRG